RRCGPSVRTKVLGGPIPDVPELGNGPFGPGNTVRLRSQSCLGVHGYDLFCPRENASTFFAELQERGAVVAGPETYDILRVEAGWPLYGVDIDENRFVVELGRTKQAISYTKGCYLGQEPIVMARDRGHVNRTLLGVKVATRDAIVARGA